MFERHREIAYISLGLAGVIFLAETVFGCIAVLGIGFGSLQDVVIDLCLTMAFPIYLIMFLSRRVAALCLWIFFLVQWVEMCLISRPPRLLNPLSGVHDVALAVGIVLFTFASVVLRREAAVISAQKTGSASTMQGPSV
jgi:hypothetical protein